MDKKQLDINAVNLALAAEAKEAILGIFGKDDGEQMISKLHTVVALAEKLRIKGMDISITLKELIKSREEYVKAVEVEDE